MSSRWGGRWGEALSVAGEILGWLLLALAGGLLVYIWGLPS